MHSRHAFRTPAEEEFFGAGKERVIEGLNDLSADELRRLSSYARYRAFRLLGRPAGIDGSDLLNEAIALTLEGRRLWNPERVPLAVHLLGAMESISNLWYRKSLTESRISDDPNDPEQECSKAFSSLERFPALEPSPEEQAFAASSIRALKRALENDRAALSVLDALLEGQTPAETRAALEIASPVYDAARKRINRKLKQLLNAPDGKRKVIHGEEP